VTTRIAALIWIKMLHEKNSTELNQLNDIILPALFKALSDSAEDVVLVDLQVLSPPLCISSSSNLRSMPQLLPLPLIPSQVISGICLTQSQFILVLTCLIQVFEEDRTLLESRGSLIIRRLCGNLDCIVIYQTLAQILITKRDVEFVSVFVQILNLILLTAPELSPLRSYLQNRDFEPRGGILSPPQFHPFCPLSLFGPLSFTHWLTLFIALRLLFSLFPSHLSTPPLPCPPLLLRVTPIRK
jgi:vacuole morphology and inheritance protein 14